MRTNSPPSPAFPSKTTAGPSVPRPAARVVSAQGVRCLGRLCLPGGHLHLQRLRRHAGQGVGDCPGQAIARSRAGMPWCGSRVPPRRRRLFHPHLRNGKPGDKHVNKLLRSGLYGHEFRVNSVATDTGQCIAPARYGFRSFDRQWIIPDGRVINQPNPTLWESFSDEQVFLTALHQSSPRSGPGITFTASVVRPRPLQRLVRRACLSALGRQPSRHFQREGRLSRLSGRAAWHAGLRSTGHGLSGCCHGASRLHPPLSRRSGTTRLAPAPHPRRRAFRGSRRLGRKR